MSFFEIKIQGKRICIPKDEETISLVLIGYNDEFDLFLNSSDYIRNRKWCEVRVKEDQDITVLSLEHCVASSPIDVEEKVMRKLLKSDSCFDNTETINFEYYGLEFINHYPVNYFRWISSLGSDNKETIFTWNESSMDDNYHPSSNHRSEPLLLSYFVFL